MLERIALTILKYLPKSLKQKIGNWLIRKKVEEVTGINLPSDKNPFEALFENFEKEVENLKDHPRTPEFLEQVRQNKDALDKILGTNKPM